MDTVELMGIEKREYPDKNTGELKEYRGLHVAYLPEEEEEGFEGRKVEVLNCPKSVNLDDLEVGGFYDLNFRMVNTKNGKMAFLKGLDPVPREEVASLLAVGVGNV